MSCHFLMNKDKRTLQITRVANTYIFSFIAATAFPQWGIASLMGILLSYFSRARELIVCACRWTGLAATCDAVGECHLCHNTIKIILTCLTFIFFIITASSWETSLVMLVLIKSDVEGAMWSCVCESCVEMTIIVLGSHNFYIAQFIWYAGSYKFLESFNLCSRS